MAGTLVNYSIGGGGVNLVKDPLQMADNEATQLQNAEMVPDAAAGGVGALTQRGGIAALTTALAGAILGVIGMPLKTTYTRTLYASLGTLDADRWAKTTNGTTWANIATPIAAIANGASYQQIGSAASGGERRMASRQNYILYPGAAHTSDLVTPANNTAMPICAWDGTTAATLLSIGIGASSSDGNYPFTVTDMLEANGTIYFAVHDPVNGSPYNGRVLSLNLVTGAVKQVATTFGFGTGAVTGGVPTVLCWYNGQLWVGMDRGDGTADVGKIVRCYPDTDATWTTDTATLPGYVRSMAVFNGLLYVGIRGSATYDAGVYVRSASVGTYAASDIATTTSGIDYAASLIVYGTSLYYMLFSDGGTDILHIRSFDGTTWGTDRDVDSSDSAGVAQPVGQAILFGADLFFCVQATAVGAGDGFILRKSSGTWSKVVTDNFTGKMGVLLERT